MGAAAVILAGLIGLIIGSFLNVVAHRLPRGESLATPGSRCPSCGEPVKPYDNIPVLSWLLLRGRCRHCGEPISWQYPAVELATGALFAAVVAARDDAGGIALGLILVTALVPIVVIDLERRLIPNLITGPAAVLALAAGLALDIDGVPEQLIAGAAAGGFFFLAAMAYPRGMGMGDVKLAGLLGLCLGRAVAPALMIALLSGVLVGGIVIARLGARAGRKTAVPFGPFLALGGAIALFAGDALVNWYSDTYL
ncbi:MAG: prepilin peptidase [Solirubrobacterales bacterium]|jgi:leader peptidase (prepilin peptidase)/N-methyltransferase|nr:prepilin peptidase [Solirubrobacterales bacterium]